MTASRPESQTHLRAVASAGVMFVDNAGQLMTGGYRYLPCNGTVQAPGRLG